MPFLRNHAASYKDISWNTFFDIPTIGVYTKSNITNVLRANKPF